MKKIVLGAAAVIALMAASCSEKSDKATAAQLPDSVAAVNSTCNFRYIDVDSIFSGYELAKELLLDEQKETNTLESVHRQKEAELQRMGTNIQNKAQNGGYLTEQSYNSDMQNFQQRMQEAERWAATSQERVANMMMNNRKRLSDSLQNYLTEFNAVCGYDAIFFKSNGFFKPELDITHQVLDGMNERYKASQQ